NAAPAAGPPAAAGRAQAGGQPAAAPASAQNGAAPDASGDRGQRRRFGGDGSGGDRAGEFGGGGFGRGRGGDGTSANRGFGGGGGGGFGGRGGDPAARLERFKSMSPDDQKQFIARLKERGQDVSAFEAAVAKTPKAGRAAKAPSAAAETIDALFAPLPTVETRGNAWLCVRCDTPNKELKRVNLRLGITDGTQTELVSGELQPDQEVVTGVVVGNVRANPAAGAQGNPLLPQGGRGNQGFGGG